MCVFTGWYDWSGSPSGGVGACCWPVSVTRCVLEYHYSQSVTALSPRRYCTTHQSIWPTDYWVKWSEVKWWWVLSVKSLATSHWDPGGLHFLFLWRPLPEPPSTRRAPSLSLCLISANRQHPREYSGKRKRNRTKANFKGRTRVVIFVKILPSLYFLFTLYHCWYLQALPWHRPSDSPVYLFYKLNFTSYISNCLLLMDCLKPVECGLFLSQN